MKKETSKLPENKAMQYEPLLPDVFKSLGLRMTEGRKIDVLTIISEGIRDDDGWMTIATDICDYLNIERRCNRMEIIDMLGVTR